MSVYLVAPDLVNWSATMDGLFSPMRIPAAATVVCSVAVKPPMMARRLCCERQVGLLSLRLGRFMIISFERV